MYRSYYTSLIYIIQISVTHSQSVTSMMASHKKDEILQIAFIGAGVINFGSPDVPWNHSSRLENLGRIKVLGIVDIDVEKAKKVLNSRKDNPIYSGCKVYETTTELLEENKNIDVVFIGTPPASRGSLEPGHDLELQCANRGVDIFVEKPLSMLPPEEFQQYYDQLMSACQRNNVIMCVGYMLRYVFNGNLTVYLYHYYLEKIISKDFFSCGLSTATIEL